MPGSLSVPLLPAEGFLSAGQARNRVLQACIRSLHNRIIKEIDLNNYMTTWLYPIQYEDDEIVFYEVKAFYEGLGYSCEETHGSADGGKFYTLHVYWHHTYRPLEATPPSNARRLNMNTNTT